MGEAGLIAAGEQLFGDDRLRLHVDDLLPIVAVDVAGGGRNEAERPWLLDLPSGKDGQRLGGEDEGVDHEDLSPVVLGDLVDLWMGAALDQERVLLAADPLQSVHEVADEL